MSVIFSTTAVWAMLKVSMMLVSSTSSTSCSCEEDTVQWGPGPRFNIKMSYQYRKSHCGDKRVVRSSYLHNGIFCTGKMRSLYWIRAQGAGTIQRCYLTSIGIPFTKITQSFYLRFIGPSEIWMKFQISNIKANFTDWWLRYFWWNCPQLIVTGYHWWYVNIGSGNGLVPSGSRPLPKLMLTQFYVTIWRH